MTNEHRRTPEEEAHDRLFEENEELLSGAARTVLGEAEAVAYAATMVPGTASSRRSTRRLWR